MSFPCLGFKPSPTLSRCLLLAIGEQQLPAHLTPSPCRADRQASPTCKVARRVVVVGEPAIHFPALEPRDHRASHNLLHGPCTCVCCGGALTVQLMFKAIRSSKSTPVPRRRRSHHMPEQPRGHARARGCPHTPTTPQPSAPAPSRLPLPRLWIEHAVRVSRSHYVPARWRTGAGLSVTQTRIRPSYK